MKITMVPMKFKILIVIFTIVSVVAVIILIKGIYASIVVMNQAESVNHILFEVLDEISTFKEKNGHLPCTFEELNCEKIPHYQALKSLDYKFLPNNDKYVFVVKANERYYCAIQKEKGYYRPIIRDAFEILSEINDDSTPQRVSGCKPEM